ncbi:anti-sigma factor [Microaerobacter geothermalis]|uniref:anti-sigma factor family protein n=1 Tax=Microaerobacter geothermalis TaxID=674972 RepID=UPI001F286CCC|nr:anti-sigma factor [Microaerobacter geothermalis]MCF6093369.1 anti-sigma factor [Microaerobacter geothermalis]
MKCSEVQGLIPEYLDRQLTDQHLREIEEHLTSCTSCQEDLQFWKDSEALIQGAIIRPDDDSSMEYDSGRIGGSVMDRIRREEKWALPLSSQMVKIPQWLPKVGAIFATVLLIGFIIASYWGSSTYNQMPVVYGEDWLKQATVEQILDVEETSITPMPTYSPRGLFQEPVVASVGDLIPYPVNQEKITNVKYIFLLSILGTIFTTLGIGWISSRSKGT